MQRKLLSRISKGRLFVLSCFLFSLLAISTKAQWIASPATITVGVTAQYQYDDGVAYRNPSFVFSNGSVVSWTLSGTTYTILLNATTPGAGQLTFNYRSGYVGSTSMSIYLANYNLGGTYCTGSTATIQLDGSQVGVSYQLYRTQGPYQSPLAGTGGALTWSGSGNGAYSVQATHTGTGYTQWMNNGQTANVIDPYPIQTKTVVGGGGYCAGGSGVSITLQQSELGSNYQVSYQLVDGGGNNVQSPKIGTGGDLTWTGITGASTYSVLAKNLSSNCTRSFSGPAVSVLPIPSVAITPSQSLCVGSTANLTIANPNGIAGTTFSWTATATNSGGVVLSGTGSSISQLLTISNNSFGDGSIAYTATATASGCSSSAGSTVTILRKPGVIVGNPSICSGATSVVTLDWTLPGTSFSWTVAQSGVTGATSGVWSGTGFSTTISQAISSASGGTAVYSITPTNNNGCVGPVTTGTVTVNANPLPPTVSGGQRFGTGSVAVYFSGVPSGGTYNLYNNSQTLIGPVGSPYNTVPLSASIANYMYVSSVSTAGCEGPKSPISVSIYSVPAISAPTSIVAKETAVTMDAGAGYDSYTWLNAYSTVVGSSQTLTTNTTGSYTVMVFKGGINAYSQPFTLNPQFTGTNANYEVTNTVQIEGITDASTLNALAADKVIQTVSYVDGLGRGLQTVQTQASPLKNDIVVPSVYDALGREYRKLMPAVTGNNGLIKSNLVAAGTYTGSVGTYSTANDKIADDSRPFAETVFEPSPMNRPLKSYGPGLAWSAGGSDRPVIHAYLTNGDPLVAGQEKIIAWNVNASGQLERNATITGYIAAGGYFAAGQLSIKSTKDEDGKEVREYTDKLGHLVLKKVQYTPSAVLSDMTNWAMTYYVYDGLGNLRYVLQPELSKQMHLGDAFYPSSADLSNFAFQYQYDGRNRMISKQVPGADPVFMVYDIRDRVVLTQDGNQRPQNKWSYNKFDALNRPVMTGIYTHTSAVSQSAMAALISTVNLNETYNGDAPNHGYTNTVWPTTSLSLLTATYYDDYSFKSMVSGLNYVSTDISGQPAAEFLQTLGKPTGAKISIVGSPTFLWGATYYDYKYRTIQSIGTNIKGGFDRVTNLYDFVRVKQSKQIHNNGSAIYTIMRTMDYDHMGRVVNVWHSLNSASAVLLIHNEYNEVGQLVDKKLHSANSGASYLQSIDYRYNIRGWLLSMNNSQLTNDGGATNDETNDFFGMELGYNNAIGTGNGSLFNGNISAMKWSQNLALGTVKDVGYNYTYDALSRIVGAGYLRNNGGVWTNPTGDFSENGYAYDYNGNIMALTRKTTAGAIMDGLTYAYLQGNRLTRVTDSGDRSKGFIEPAGTTGTETDYIYDFNGNMTVDLNKGITAITYNHLNLPVQVNKGATDYIVYTYDAGGKKLKQQVFGATPKTTEYLGDYIYENNVLQFINTEEGRIVMTGSSPEYQYHLKDHLGNVRMTVTTLQVTDNTSAGYEPANQASEQSQFLRYSNSRLINTSLFNHTAGGTYSERLNGSANEKYGLARSLSVMPGDVINAEVYAKYVDPNSANWTGPLTTLMGQIAAGNAAVVVDGAGYTTSTSSFPYGGLLSTSGSTGGPKAYLNWLIFDRNYNLITGGYKRLSAAPKETGSNVPHELMASPALTITQPGYVYIYLSNEETTAVEVFFDDLKVTQIKSPVVQADEYYPFGLKYGSYSRENSMVNRNHLFQNQEHVDDLGLNWDTYKWRNHQPEIGRFFNVDPLSDKYVYNSTYAFSENLVTNHVELEGLEAMSSARAREDWQKETQRRWDQENGDNFRGEPENRPTQRKPNQDKKDEKAKQTPSKPKDSKWKFEWSFGVQAGVNIGKAGFDLTILNFILKSDDKKNDKPGKVTITNSIGLSLPWGGGIGVGQAQDLNKRFASTNYRTTNDYTISGSKMTVEEQAGVKTIEFKKDFSFKCIIGVEIYQDTGSIQTNQ